MPNTRKWRRCEMEDKIVPPDGGWGYVVVVAVIIVNYATVAPMISFGLIYGPFLATIGDETSGTSLMASTFMTVFSLTGFTSSFLLRKYSARIVCSIGAALFSLGYFLEIFLKDFVFFMVTHGLMRGMGCSLMLSSSMTIMNSYFEKKLNLVMGFYQALTSTGAMMSPLVVGYLMEHLGFSNSLCVFTGFSLLTFPAIATLRPVTRHTQRQLSKTSQELAINSAPSPKQPESHTEPLVPLLMTKSDGNQVSTSQSIKDWFLNTVGLRLLGDFKYLNMTVGQSFPYITDSLFCSLLRMILNNMKFETSDVALMMTVFFCFDVMSKVSYSVVSGFYTLSNRRVFLVSAVTIAIFRICLTYGEGFYYKLIILSLIGTAKGFQETSYPLVISDQFKENYSTAWSLSMVISGFSFFVIANLISYIREVTQTDSSIIYTFAVINSMTFLLWITESIYRRFFAKKSESEL